MTISLHNSPRGDASSRVTPTADEIAHELKRALLPAKRAHHSSYIRNLTRRIQKDLCSPHVHAYELLAAKQDAGESPDQVLAFPVTLMSAIRLRIRPAPSAEDFASISDSETEMQGLLDRVQLQIAFAATPCLIRHALDLITGYRTRLDALEAFLRARLASFPLTVAR